jgi:hypothetical protein
MKFFHTDLSACNAGLSHQMSNFNTLIRYCYHNNLKLIKPIFTLTGVHNNNKTLKSDLSKYYNLDDLTIDDKPFTLYDYDNNIHNNENTIKYKAKNSLIRMDKGFADLSGVVNVPYVKEIINISNYVSSKFNDYMCIHVRRGDRITNRQKDIDTKPNNIKNIIDKYNINIVYIMTNRVNEIKGIVSLVDNVKIYFYTDFDILKKIDDNYYLFCIENNIMNSATIRCSTFNTNNDFYHCYLSNHKGCQ